MKIDKLVIYGFGKHEDVTIAFGPSINIVYGHNEAGKTTIQQFILHILFGFPPRNSQLLRYEPKTGSKYGGQVHINDAVYGKCVIERVRGKSSGDVKVYFENGEQGEEEALRKLVRQYDRASFESIFSFSLLQLQGFEKMDEQQLSRTLLASGTTGVDDLLQIESKMEKEMELLFKRNGRNPTLNQKVNQLRTLEQQLQAQQNRMENYAPAIQRLKEIDEALQALREQNEAFANRVGQLSTKRQLYPLFVKRTALEKRFKAISAQRFPTDGIQRYESIHNKLAEAKATVFSLQREIERIQEALLEQAEEEKLAKFERLIRKESKWHLMLSSVATLKTNDAQLFERKKQLRTRLGIQTDEETDNLLQADASIRKEEEMYELLERLKSYGREIDMIEKERLSLKDELERLEGKEQFLTPPSEERIEQAKKWPSVRQQLAEAKAYFSFHRQQQQQSKMIGMILLAVTLFLIGYGIIGKQYGILLIASIVSAIALFFMKRRMKDSKADKMKEILATYGGQEQEMEAVLAQVNLFETEKANHEEEKINIEMDMRHLKETYDALAHQIHQTETDLQSFLIHYGIDGLPSANLIPELFRMIREIQEVTRQMMQNQKEREQLNVEIQNHQTEVEQLLAQSLPKEGLYEWIRKEHQILLQAVERQKVQKMRKNELEQECQEKNALIQLLTEQKQALFQEAAVHDEESYYKAHQVEQEKASLEEQLNNINMQLAVHGELEMDMSQTDVSLENSIYEMKEKKTAINEKLTGLVEEKARLENETKALLTDETYSKLQQQFEVERAQFTDLAKKWATKKTIAEAIRQMMNELKENKFPRVLQEAASRFSKLTGGRYESIVITEQGYFEVVSKEGIRFPIVELSQATKEQAYISLRFALAASMIETAPFPIIMDDPFVHFDETRLSHIIEVLEQSTEHQWIYFTCHKEMMHRFKQATTINVSEIGNE